jgi:hypothetical protein
MVGNQLAAGIGLRPRMQPEVFVVKVDVEPEDGSYVLYECWLKRTGGELDRMEEGS